VLLGYCEYIIKLNVDTGNIYTYTIIRIENLKQGVSYEGKLPSWKFKK